ncbi:MAG: PhnD/SsuA/transferrin family substrate-binding protein [gamma proteobacterium symbiont of Bathyaustriella thionipta]|nr:PhnD/SsuA/transferrin family substrate-binding protein [gamma proteobacterium symbiont of Bathyaustriella thionipta]MCU7949824.1 PhnD/SsuA/transferrin family substrate-binding protein [gamma proteobacterium symbiont of Bathyaustriella thionipta]MCU7952690.1 PhnD/SsuA/transferrin family substrate-binding protein [gamma proteobacterium symbiont of Bathyaustriella thionipta]MCU7956568.1 PhnD/SsuA/transferrin family substrate-binding protein [gamma proteobacterium symbiont of Bathyaustriella thio
MSLSELSAGEDNNKDKETIYIGVLSHRGDDATQKTWSPTAHYLTETLGTHQFKIIPLDFDEIDPAVSQGKVDFLLVNSGIYVNLEVRYRISRIVTLNNSIDDIPLNVFGGVIFARQKRNDIDDIRSLTGKRFMAVDETSLGGFQMAWRIIKKAGIDPYKDFLSMSFAGTHDEVVMAVKKGIVDVGTVRTGILETMASKGDIKLDEFKIISPIANDGFPYLHSTSLYPEWPFSKLKHTSNDLAHKVAVALLKMSNIHTLESEHDGSGWTIPLSYQSVHELFKELDLPPYEVHDRFTLLDAIKRYWKGIAIILLFVLMMTIMSTWIARLNRELKKSKISLEHQHDLILNSVCDGIYGVDMEGNCVFMNRSMCLNTGWEIGDFQSGNQHDLLHHTHEDGSEHKKEECPVYLTFMDKQQRYIDNDIFWKKDGTSFPVEYSSTPMIDHKGDVIGSVVVFRDISERKLADEEKRRHQTEIAHMARLNTMGEMASGIAHELNQPLTAIATNSFACIQMLEAGDIKKDKLMDILETIGLQAQHSGEIIKQLRQFVRKEQPERSIININDLIKEVLLFVATEARKANVKIICNSDKNIPEVLVQPIQIEQVLLNLLKNSIEALQSIDKENRRLIITTEVVGGNAVIVTVEDNGPGIDEGIKEGLFDPFITSKNNGLGLGLSISQGIIESHHGKLYLHSASKGSMNTNKGTVFRFALPVVSKVDEMDKTVSAKNLVR